MKTTIGSFLLSRLRTIGVRHVFGVPGDYNLPLLEQLDAVAGLEFVPSCNELNAAYAADGNARLNGVSALMTTYGVGELSALNGVAGACAEHVPVVCITGAPPLHAIERRMLLHHTLADGEFDNTMRCFREFTAAQARLTPASAASEIDRVLRAALREKRPVYLQVPSDISHLTIEVPSEPLSVEAEASDPERLGAAVARVGALLASARHPALLVDMDAERFALAQPLAAIVDAAGMPFAVLSTAKCALDETSPLYLGVYSGRGSQPAVRERIEGADLLLALAPRFIDTNSTWFSQKLPEATVYVEPLRVTAGSDVYEGVHAKDFLLALREQIASVAGAAAPRNGGSPDPRFVGDAGARLTHDRFWTRIASFFRPRDVVIAETGTSRVALTGIRMPHGVTFISQGLWGSIGYTLPALLGSLLAAPDRRHLLFIGDGSFQLTVQELSTLLHRKLPAVIFLINNGGYTVERLILGEDSSHNDVANWDYTKLAQVFAPAVDCFTARVETEGELEEALTQVGHARRPALVEVILGALDASELLKRSTKILAEFEYGPRGPQRAGRATEAPR
jgi:indolepyruvate decarboxylase